MLGGRTLGKPRPATPPFSNPSRVAPLAVIGVPGLTFARVVSCPKKKYKGGTNGREEV